MESSLDFHGNKFTRRFDANSYLYITRAMDYFDLAAPHGGVLAEAFKARGAEIVGDLVLAPVVDGAAAVPRLEHRFDREAQLFSGRDFESSVVGRAWLSSACTSNRFGVTPVKPPSPTGEPPAK